MSIAENRVFSYTTARALGVLQSEEDVADALNNEEAFEIASNLELFVTVINGRCCHCVRFFNYMATTTTPADWGSWEKDRRLVFYRRLASDAVLGVVDRGIERRWAEPTTPGDEP